MFQDLDDTLEALLDDGGAPTELRNAAVSFETPDKNFAPAQPTINLFLYEVKENRDLRDPVPITEIVAGQFVRRMPPLRVDCCYLVTAWSAQTGAAKIVEEHRLLAQAIAWLTRFTTVPDSFLQGSLAGQPFAPPTLVAQMDGDKNSGEFWTALGSSPRPGFYVVVSIALELGLESPEGPPVVTKEIQLTTDLIAETTFQIAGTVRDDATAAPVANAEVIMVELNRAVTTAPDGRFYFVNVSEGTHTLRISASGFATREQVVNVPATVLNEYDVSLTP
jgi:hypothetical protein